MHLTAAGRRALGRADGPASTIERRLADSFTDHERETLIALLKRCAEALDGQRPNRADNGDADTRPQRAAKARR